MNRLVASAVGCLVVMISCGGQEEVGVDLSGIGVFEETACPMPVPEGFVEGETVRCGWVRVPTFHSDPARGTMELPVAIFKSIAESPEPDPLTIAMAGPGTSALVSVTPAMATPIGQTLLARRDIVLVDYRGLPLARPNLMCPELDDVFFQSMGEDLSAEDFLQRRLDGVAACRDRLQAEDVELDAFTSVESAADLVMVMDALGYERFNLYGSSAGTIVAQQLMRNHGDRLRSVIMDSTVPVGRSDVHTEAPMIAANVLRRVIELCRENPTCAGAFPELEAEMAGLVARYNAEPIVLEVVDPQTGEPATFIINGDRLAHAILMLSSQTGTIPLLPVFIHDLAEGRVGVVSNFAWAFSPPPPPFSHGLGLTVFCAEYSGFNESDLQYGGTFPDYQRAVAANPFGAKSILTSCETWDVDPVLSDAKEPVRSDVPTLLIAGEVDSLTPPSWALEVADGLSDSRVYEIPGYGHSAVFSGPCPFSLMFQFLNDPTQPPDDSCIADLKLEFLIPE